MHYTGQPYLNSWLIDWILNGMIRWLKNSLIHSHLLMNWPIGWLINWLIDWLVGWFIYLFIYLLLNNLPRSLLIWSRKEAKINISRSEIDIFKSDLISLFIYSSNHSFYLTNNLILLNLFPVDSMWCDLNNSFFIFSFMISMIELCPIL